MSSCRASAWPIACVRNSTAIFATKHGWKISSTPKSRTIFQNRWNASLLPRLRPPFANKGSPMKVVLFCGGLGTRIRESSESVPKPMVPIGYRPLLWHVMKYYAHFGHKDFILCLGYKADVVKSYFLNYDECVSNNFVLCNGGNKLKLLNSDIHDWNITFVDTGISANIGQRLKAVEPYLEGESMFLANYSDGLTNLPLPEYIDHFRTRGKVGSFLAVKPNLSSHAVLVNGDLATGIQPVSKTSLLINGGFFVFRHEIFDY